MYNRICLFPNKQFKNIFNKNKIKYKEFEKSRKNNYNKIIPRYYSNFIPPQNDDESWLFIIILASSVYIINRISK